MELIDGIHFSSFFTGSRQGLGTTSHEILEQEVRKEPRIPSSLFQFRFIGVSSFDSVSDGHTTSVTHYEV